MPLNNTYTKKELARALCFSRTLFYHQSKIALKDTKTAQDILDLHTNEDDTLGVKKLSAMLKIGKNKCRRVMRKYNIVARKHVNKYVYPGKSDVVFPNLLLTKDTNVQDIYYSDIFEFRLADGTKVYGCFVLKLSTRQILAIVFDYVKTAYLVKDTLIEASTYVTKNSIYHSDQGKQYGAEVQVLYVNDLKLKISMSRAGTPTDNPFAERFVETFKLAVVEKRKYFTLGDFLEESYRWLDFYLNRRPHEALDNKSPNQYATEIGEKIVSLKRLFRV